MYAIYVYVMYLVQWSLSTLALQEYTSIPAYIGTSHMYTAHLKIELVIVEYGSLADIVHILLLALYYLCRKALKLFSCLDGCIWESKSAHADWESSQ